MPVPRHTSDALLIAPEEGESNDKPLAGNAPPSLVIVRSKTPDPSAVSASDGIAPQKTLILPNANAALKPSVPIIALRKPVLSLKPIVASYSSIKTV